MLRSLVLVLATWVAAGKYSLIIDAGSSGSRLRIFRTSAGKELRRHGEEEDSGVVVESVRPTPGDEALFRTEPGVSSFAGHPEGAGPSLAGLLEVAKAYVPAEERAATSLWVKATAGMRRVPRPQADLIFRHLEEYLRRPEHCPFRLVSTAILGGEEEAVYAFLGINTLLAEEEQPASAPGAEPSSSSSSSPWARGPVGVMDMGGASMQVAYKPDSDILDGEFHFYAGEERQSIYARSFIQFGLETAIDRAVASLARSMDRETSSLEFPCFNRGFSQIMRIEGRRLRVLGTGDSERCGEVTRRLLHADYECLLPPCPFMGVHVPEIAEDKQFYGLSNFFYIPNGLGLLGWDEEKVVRPAEIAAATAEFCGRSIESVTATADTPLKYLRNFCFGGHYVWHVLKALGFSDNSTSMTSLRKLRHHSADWTYGAVLYETLDMPQHRSAAPGAAGAAPPCRAPPAQPLPEPVPQEEARNDALQIARPPSILGVPGWWLWLGGLAAASMLGLFMHILPYRCCDLKFGEAAFEVPNVPMSPVSFLSPDSALAPPTVFRAVSAPMLQTYLPMGRPRRSSERKVTWAHGVNP